jgi:hypothetical protein
MATIQFNLVDFVYSIDFANILVKYISSKDFLRLSLVSKKINSGHILQIVENDYMSL